LPTGTELGLNDVICGVGVGVGVGIGVGVGVGTIVPPDPLPHPEAQLSTISRATHNGSADRLPQSLAIALRVLFMDATGSRQGILYIKPINMARYFLSLARMMRLYPRCEGKYQNTRWKSINLFCF
jgi:hypothetical protein